MRNKIRAYRRWFGYRRNRKFKTWKLAKADLQNRKFLEQKQDELW